MRKAVSNRLSRLKLFIVRANSRRIKQSPIDKKQPEFFNLLPHHFVIFGVFKTKSYQAVVAHH
nr:hypothetical protein [Proteiniphilum sp. UBA4988]